MDSKWVQMIQPFVKCPVHYPSACHVHYPSVLFDLHANCGLVPQIIHIPFRVWLQGVEGEELAGLKQVCMINEPWRLILCQGSLFSRPLYCSAPLLSLSGFI
ncbi:hypothetical protein DUNSADRAFT_18158 [Dunaliella salina]|uniref:Encoded protein n=1 Tax=Dunaliella salina TaxID=3046 RepID=A0ABQ7G0J9_DUNSA|nr:hypothetical protein DUNSADRAFT_18158 [Dunaliella salina]|eukprot:KAF5828136.1 hypothetical protein DUNSADRAFT_18158 [Dunaliella salina]